jgi:RNA polymerase sigma factor (sigma-70 family)
MEKDRAQGMPCNVSSGGAGVARVPEERSSDQIYLEHGVLLRRVAMSKFGIPCQDAEALVHDVFINYLIRPRTVHSDLRAYLIGAICNASRNYWRSRRSEDRVFAEPEDDAPDAVSEDVFAGLALNLVIASTLARLGTRCREVLRRYYLEGEDSASIARAMNTTPTNVNYIMHVCRKQARTIYQSITRVPTCPTKTDT